MMNTPSNENSENLNMSTLFPRPANGNALPTLAEWNQRYIEYVLSYTKGKKTAAARILGINRRTLYRRKKVEHGYDMAFNRTNDTHAESSATPQQ